MTEKAVVPDLNSPSPLSIFFSTKPAGIAHITISYTHTERDHLSRRCTTERMPKATAEMRRQNRSCDQCRKAKRACDLYLRDPQHSVKRPSSGAGRAGNVSVAESYLGKRLRYPPLLFHPLLAVTR